MNFSFLTLLVASALLLAQPARAQVGFADVGVISATMGVSDGRICTGEFSRGDIGCAANAPYVSRTTGWVGVGTNNPSVTLTVSGTGFMNMLTLKGGTGMASPSAFQGGYWTTGGNGIYYDSGNIGVGSTPATTARAVILGDTLGSTAGNSVTALTAGARTSNYDVLDFSAYRISAGSSWLTAAQRIQRRVDSTPMGYIQFGKHDTTSPGLISFGNGSTELARIDYNGNVGIGTAAPNANLQVESAKNYTGTTPSSADFGFGVGLTGGAYVGMGRYNSQPALQGMGTGTSYRLLLNPAGGNVGIGTDSPGAKLEVVGTIMVGNAQNQSKIAVSGYGGSLGYGIDFTPANNTSTRPLYFRNSGGTVVGSITTDGTTTTYNTTSDYRLKEHVGHIGGALARVGMLKPSRFSFKADPSHTVVDGFIAHEVQVVAPYAVTGKKDAEDGDGEPIYQQVDYGKLTPLLTAAIQELKAANDNLAADNAALRASHAADIKELRAELEALKRAIPAPARH